MPQRKRTTILAILGFIIIGISILLDGYLRSFNEIHDPSSTRIKTKVGDYVSERPMGTLPVRLFWSLKKWPDRASCLSDPTTSVLNWAHFKGTIEIEVCLTRVLGVAQTPQEIEMILAANGFSRQLSRARVSAGEIIELASVCEKKDLPCSLAIDALWGLALKPYAFSLRVSMFEGKVISVEVVPLTL